MGKDKFIEIQFKNKDKKWVGVIFNDSPQNHIPKWYRKKLHTMYVITLGSNKRKKLIKRYNIIKLVKHYLRYLKRLF